MWPAGCQWSITYQRDSCLLWVVVRRSDEFSGFQRFVAGNQLPMWGCVQMMHLKLPAQIPVQTRRLTVGMLALAFAFSVGVAQPAQAAIPRPPSKALPAALDARMGYQPQVSCDPRSKPGVTAFAALMTARYKTGSVGTYRPCQSGTSEHYDSRALDWMLSVYNPRQKAVASSVTAWLSANNGAMARRFGISYMIFNKRIWGAYAPERGWAAYSGSDPHTSHIHISFAWDGAMKRTSWWTGKATTVADLGPCVVYRGQYAPLQKGKRTGPCPEPRTAPRSVYRVATYGQTSAQIKVAQRRLGLEADGQFGSVTFRRLIAWQTGRVPITGVLDKATWRRMTGK